MTGTVSYSDVWDFNPPKKGESWRGEAGDYRVALARLFLPGKPFQIESETVDFVLEPGWSHYKIGGVQRAPIETSYSAKGRALITEIANHLDNKPKNKTLTIAQTARLLVALSRSTFEPAPSVRLCITLDNLPRDGSKPDLFNGILILRNFLGEDWRLS